MSQPELQPGARPSHTRTRRRDKLITPRPTRSRPLREAALTCFPPLCYAQRRFSTHSPVGVVRRGAGGLAGTGRRARALGRLTRLMLYRSILRPLLFRLPPETAHEMALSALSIALKPEPLRRLASRRYGRGAFGALTRFGLRFENPVGLAAGFDKNGKVYEGMAALGFGFVEVGTVTHLPQPGNPHPRLFRLPLDRALVNRQGFNNEGAAALAGRLARGRTKGCVLGVNIGKSRAVGLEDATADYLASFRLVHRHA